MASIVEKKGRDEGAKLTGKRRLELEEVALLMNLIFKLLLDLRHEHIEEVMRYAEMLQTQTLNKNTQIRIGDRLESKVHETTGTIHAIKTEIYRILFHLKDMGARIEPRWESHVYENDD